MSEDGMAAVGLVGGLVGATALITAAALWWRSRAHYRCLALNGDKLYPRTTRPAIATDEAEAAAERYSASPPWP